MKKWTYKIVYKGQDKQGVKKAGKFHVSQKDHPNLEDALNSLTQEGWDFVTELEGGHLLFRKLL